MNWKKLVLIGDSNIQYGFSGEGRWVSLLADLLQRKCDVINRGFSGYNTKYLKYMLPELLAEFKPETICGIIILLGSNDSAKSGSNQHVPLENYISSLEWILNYITNEYGLDKSKVIVISPPRINDVSWKEYCDKMNYEMNHFDHLVTEYSKACVSVSAKKGVSCLDIHKLMSEKKNGYSELLIDGLHFSALGSQFLFDHLRPIVESFIGSNLKFYYPYWKDLDPTNPVLKQ